MKTQHQYSTAHQGIQSVAMMVGAVVVLVVTSLIVLTSQPAPAAIPANSATSVAPAVYPPRPLTTNRFFQDEIGAASALDLGDPQSLLAPWPERLSDQETVTAPLPVAPAAQPRPAITNRIFLDEIGGAAGADGGTIAPIPGETTNQHGPR